MTLFAAVSITIPFYSHIFFPDNKKEVIIIDNNYIQEIEIKIEGMTNENPHNEIILLIIKQVFYNSQHQQ